MHDPDAPRAPRDRVPRRGGRGRDLGDVLHLFLDDAPPQPPATSRARWTRLLARLDPPLRWRAGPVEGFEATLEAVACDPAGRAVVVMQAGARPANACDPLTRGLAQLAWLARDPAAAPLRAGLDARDPALVLVGDGFPPALRRAAAHLGPSRVRLVRRFSHSEG